MSGAMSLALCLHLLILVGGSSASEGLLVPTGFELYSKVAKLVLPHGYPLEEHFVTTKDGYILRVFRLPHGKGAPSSSPTRSDPRPVVLLQHGLLDSCAGSLLNGPGKGLAFMLADAGYDVWLANSRGTTYSRNHTRLPLTSPDFWAFSWDDMAAADLPATVDLVLSHTHQDTLSLVGHSQGTTIILAALSSNPLLAARVKVAALLAPVAIVNHITSVPLVALAAMNTDQIFTLLGITEFFPSVEILSQLEGWLCQSQPYLCINVLAAICGYNPDNLDMDRLPLYLQYTPAGTSVQNMAHWSQAVRQTSPNTMIRFDYGARCTSRPMGRWTGRCNQVVYGRATPPKYHLDHINTPLALFTGGHDRLSDPLGLEYLLEMLGPGVMVYHHHEPTYEHLDFIWGINAPERVYGRVLEVLKVHSGPQADV